MRAMLEMTPSLVVLEPLAANTIRSTALIAIAALVALAMRRAPASRRHLVWTLALLGCLVMPLASLVVPTWSLPEMPAWANRTETAAFPAPDAAPAPAVSVTPGRPDPAPRAAALDTPAETRSSAAATWRIRWADVFRMLPLLWVAGVALILGRHLLGWAVLSRVARRATAMTDAAWQAALARHSATLGLARAPALRVSPEISVPIVCGALRPTILLPVDALDWPDERRGNVLLHELAHVRRRDLIMARATQIASTLYWFNPFVWVAARAQRAEAERACDDQVLDAGSRASVYASDLLEFAQAIGGSQRLDTAALAMARRSQLEGRLLAILDPRRPRGPAGRIAVSLSALLAVASIVVLAAARPAQSRFADREQSSAMQAMDVIAEPDVGIADVASTVPATSNVEAVTATPVSPTSPVATQSDGLSLVAAKTGHVEETSTDGSSSWSIRSNGKDQTRSGTWTINDRRGSFKSRGKIQYSPDLDDIVSISSGGYVEIEDWRDGKRHRAVFEGRSGSIERSYSIDGNERPWDADARAWLAKFLIDLDSSSGAFVEERFPRLMSEGGPSRVLREVSEMTSDYGRSVYFRKLIDAGIDDATMRRLVTQAGNEIRSDYELAQTLMAAAKKNALADAGTRAAFLAATQTLQSDYEHSRVLQELLERRDLSDALIADAIVSASQLESDYEQAQVMVAMAVRGHIKPKHQPGYIQAATSSIESDYERGRILQALLEKSRVGRENLDELLLATARFSSDYERANVMVAIAESVPLDQAGRAAYRQAADGFSSDYERDRALSALARASSK